MTMQTVAGALVGLAMADNTDLQKLNLEKGMAKDNIDFVRAYKTEIVEQMEQFRTLQEKYPSVSFDSESK